MPDSIRADTPETPIAEALAGGKAIAVARFTTLIDDRLSTDDVAIVLLKRARI